jgi:hypothetical protein
VDVDVDIDVDDDVVWADVVDVSSFVERRAPRLSIPIARA